MSFGRKGVPEGATFDAAPRTSGFRAAPEPTHDPYAEKRAAFLAQERAAGGFAFADVDEADLLRQAKADAKRDGTAAWGIPASKTWDKSIAIAYVLWFFAGIVAAHRLYTGRYVSAVIQAAIGVIAIGMLITMRRSGIGDSISGGIGVGDGGIAMLLFLTYGAWRIVDLFLIPGMCRKPPGGQ